MDQQKKQQVPKEEPVSSVSERKAASHSTGWRKLFGRKWVFPAAYVAAAAIILSLMWFYQGSRQETLINEDLGLSTSVEQGGTLFPDNDVMPVTAPAESMKWPVADMNAMEQVLGYYDEDGDQEAKAAAMIRNGYTFTPSMGVSLARPDQQSFDIMAAMSGVVTRVDQLPLIGHMVEITHEDGLQTIYQSLSNVRVKEDDQVSQGMVIAQAGRNEWEKDQGVHVHFEVLQNGSPVNPNQIIASQDNVQTDSEPVAGANSETSQTVTESVVSGGL